MGPGSDGPMAHSWWSFLYEAGGEEWKLAPGGVPDPRAKQAFQFMKDLYTAAAPKDTPAIDYDQARAYLLQGKTAMEWDWHDVGVMAMQAHQLDEIGVMNFPAGPAGPYGIAHGWGVVVNKYGDNFKKNKQAVIDYELYLMRPDVHEITAKDELPAYKSTYADSAFMTKLFKDNPMSALASQWWKWRRTRQFTPKHGAEYMNGQGKLATQGIYGQATVDQTLIDMQNLIDSLKE